MSDNTDQWLSHVQVSADNVGVPASEDLCEVYIGEPWWGDE